MKNWDWMRNGIACASCALLVGCVTSERERTRLYRMADHVAAEITLDTPGLQSELNLSVGFLVIAAEEPWLPGFPGERNAVLVDRRNGERFEVRVTDLSFLGGDGIEEYHLLMLFRDEEDLDKAREGAWSYDRDESRELWLVYFKPTFGTAIDYDLESMAIRL